MHRSRRVGLPVEAGQHAGPAGGAASMAAPVKGMTLQSTQLEEKVNILVVDDLPEKHVVFRTILEELGQNIVSARRARRRCVHPGAGIRGHPARREHAGHRRPGNGRPDPPVQEVGADADHFHHRVRRRRAGQARLRAGRGRLHPVAGRAGSAAVEGAGVRRAVPHEPAAAAAGGGSAKRWRARKPRARPPKKRSSAPTYLAEASRCSSRSLNIEDTIEACSTWQCRCWRRATVVALTNADGCLAPARDASTAPSSDDSAGCAGPASRRLRG